MATDESVKKLQLRRRQVARSMVLTLPSFGRWSSTLRDFETPYGKAGIRQLEALYFLRHGLLDPSIPVATALTEAFGIQRSVMTRILSKLESAGYISREPDPNDGRAWKVTITEQGRNLSDYVEAEFFKVMEDAIADLSDADIASLERAVTLFPQILVNLGMGESTRFEQAQRDEE